MAGGWGRNGGARVQNGCGWKQAGHRVCRAAMDHDARKKLLEERKKKLEEMKLKRAGCAGRVRGAGGRRERILLVWV